MLPCPTLSKISIDCSFSGVDALACPHIDLDVVNCFWSSE
jgi:hypothetical protein